jgi:hypothetical protein
MCYSAQIWADYKKYVRVYGVELSIKDFYDIFWRRVADSKVKIPKAMEAAFLDPWTDEEFDIKKAIEAFNAEQLTKLEQELFKQRRRLADADRTLATKTTKAAVENQRIAADKIQTALGRLIDIGRGTLEDRDSRIFPGHFAPVLVMENGKRGHQADAVPVPAGRQTRQLRHEVPGHLQRTP